MSEERNRTVGVECGILFAFGDYLICFRIKNLISDNIIFGSLRTGIADIHSQLEDTIFISIIQCRCYPEILDCHFGL